MHALDDNYKELMCLTGHKTLSYNFMIQIFFFQFALKILVFISRLLFVQKSINVHAFTQSLYLSYLQLINGSKINLINKLLAKVKAIYHVNFISCFDVE